MQISRSRRISTPGGMNERLLYSLRQQHRWPGPVLPSTRNPRLRGPAACDNAKKRCWIAFGLGLGGIFVYGILAMVGLNGSLASTLRPMGMRRHGVLMVLFFVGHHRLRLLRACWTSTLLHAFRRARLLLHRPLPFFLALENPSLSSFRFAGCGRIDPPVMMLPAEGEFR